MYVYNQTEDYFLIRSIEAGVFECLSKTETINLPDSLQH